MSNNSSDNLYKAVKTSYWEKAHNILRYEPNNIQHQAEYVDDRGKNALHHACSDPCTPHELIRLLLNASSNAPLTRDENGNTPLHHATAVSYYGRWLANFMKHLAIEESSNEIILMMVQACPRAASVTNKEGETPLHKAIFRNRSINIVEALLVANPRATMAINKRGLTPLDRFFENWHLGLRNLFMSLGGSSPPLSSFLNMYINANYGTRKKVEKIYDQTILLLKARAAADNTRGNFPGGRIFRSLHSLLKIKNCPWSFYKLLQKVHPREEIERDNEGNLPLHIIAAAKGDDAYEIFCTILRNNYLAATIPNREGRLALNIALENGKYVKEGDLKAILHADPQALVASDGKTDLLPFMMAAAATAVDDGVKKENRSMAESLWQLSTVFYLLREDPSFAAWGIPARGIKRKRNEIESS